MKIRIVIIVACAATFALAQTDLGQAASKGNLIGMTSAGGSKGYGIVVKHGEYHPAKHGQYQRKKLPGRMKSEPIQ